ncbi:MAG: prolyl oligopeptidase family serine peptidase, partial [Cyclobacteriaceae bacterium]
PSAKWAFSSFSTFDSPPVTTLVSLPDHKVKEIINSNEKLVAKLKVINPSPVAFEKVDIGEGISLDAWTIKPPDFDPAKKYPVIFNVYSMPAAQTTQDSWKGGNYLFYQLLARNGFIVMGIDGRGTPVLSGREWRKCIYKKHGILPSDDIAKATRVLIDKHSYIDAKRIGVFGWSGGGLMSLLLILRYPDLFQAAVPGAYISNHRYYHAGFTERFMGTPQDNPEAYEETAVLTYAENLKGDLLIMHGTGDDNVNYQNTELLVNKLIEMKKRFAVVPYPNRSHGLREGINTHYHRYDTYLWFFTEHLHPDK